MRTGGGLEAGAVSSLSVGYTPEATCPSVSSGTCVRGLPAHLHNLATAEGPGDTQVNWKGLIPVPLCILNLLPYEPLLCAHGLSSPFGGEETEVKFRLPLCLWQALPCLGGLTGRSHTVLTIHDKTCIVVAFPLPSFERPCGVGKEKGHQGRHCGN